MKYRKLLLFMAIAVVVSLAISWLWTPRTYEEQLTRIQAERKIAYIDKNIMNEPIGVQAILLNYSGDKELLLKAWIALSKYPEIAKKIFLLYGSEPEFKEILIDYGDSIIPPIKYFMENDIWSIKITDAAGKVIQSGTESVKNLWNRISGNKPTSSNSATETQTKEFGPKERGWYAVNFIKQEGHDFLGQFVVDKSRNVKWVYTDRFLKDITSFFTSGIRTLETKYDSGEEITKSDVLWATVDVAAAALPAFKLLKGGEVVAESGEAVESSGEIMAESGEAVESSGKELSLVSRTRLFGSKLLKALKKWWKYGAGAGLAVILTHPSLINPGLAMVAKVLGLPPWLLQFVGWFIIVTVALYFISWPLKTFAYLVSVSAKNIKIAIAWLEQT